MVGPKFMAAEPGRIDGSRHEDLHLCSHCEEIETLILIKGFKPGLQNKVHLSKDMSGDDLPEGHLRGIPR
jgi:hypothetical protein